MEVPKEKISRAIEVFNRFRAPEAVAKLLSVRDDVFEVEFSGPYCKTCGYYDYFEDLVYEADEVGLKINIVDIKDMADYAIVKFKVVAR